MKHLVLALLVVGCTDPSQPRGELVQVENSGGFCSHDMAWCGWDLVIDPNSDELTATSRGAAGEGHGHLTVEGSIQLSDLVQKIPMGSPSDDSTNCADAPIITFHIDYDDGKRKEFHFSCTPGVFQKTNDFIGGIVNSLITGVATELVTLN